MGDHPTCSLARLFHLLVIRPTAGLAEIRQVAATLQATNGRPTETSGVGRDSAEFALGRRWPVGPVRACCGQLHTELPLPTFDGRPQGPFRSWCPPALGGGLLRTRSNHRLNVAIQATKFPWERVSGFCMLRFLAASDGDQSCGLPVLKPPPSTAAAFYSRSMAGAGQRRFPFMNQRSGHTSGSLCAVAFARCLGFGHPQT